MINLVQVTNPFQPGKGTIKALYPEGLTIREVLKRAHGDDFKEFAMPTIALLNGQPVKRDRWDSDRLKSGDVLATCVVPGDPFTIIAIIAVAVIAAVAISTLARINQPKIPGQIPEPDPVYNLVGQKNQVRLTYPIEIAYGRCRLWPSYAAKVYNQYINNDQYQFQLFCLGQGSYTIHEIRIEDTQIASFQDVTYAVYQPGESVTLFPDNVVTSVEVAGIELFAPNEAEYPAGGGWVGGFVINSAFTTCNRIEVDIILPQGLYYSNNKGGLDARTGEAEFEYRQIDDEGDPVGGWILLTSFAQTLKTTTPQRFTLSANVTPARYEVRARRTNDKDTSSRAGNTVTWDAVRAFLPSTQDYGDVTMLAVKARASNNLNDSASNRVNVIATRKLRRYVDGAWTAPAATRSIVWAFCDMFTALYGGRLEDGFLDLDTLVALDADYTTRGDTFDWVFDQKTTIWDAAKSIARAGRAVPMLNGTKITMVRDDPNEVPVAVFSPENIVEGSFRREIKIADLDEVDGLEIEYVDENTFKSETLLCCLPGEEGENPERMKLPGVTKRGQAYHEGLYLRASNRHLRENVVFKTGYEGLIPVFGDMIAVGFDLLRKGESGRVVSIVGTTLTLSKPVVFQVGLTHQILLRKKDGSAAGPYTVTAGTASNKVVSASAISEDFFFDDQHEPPYYLFGSADRVQQNYKVTNVIPSEEEEVEIQAVIYNPVVHSFDDVDPPPLVGSTIPNVPDLPTIYGFTAQSSPADASIVLLTWNPALGAQSYLIQQSTDNVNWDNVARVTATTYTLPVRFGYLYLRVAGINAGIGPFSTWEGNVGVSTDSPTTVTGLALAEAFLGTAADILWNVMAVAAQYRVKVYTNAGATLKRTTNTVANTFSYSRADATTDGGTVSRNLRFNVVAINGVGVESATAAILDVTNPAPDVLTGLSAPLVDNQTAYNDYAAQFTASTAPDLDYYRVYGSATNGFTPGPGNLLYQGPASLFLIRINKTAGAHPAYYWRAVAIDVWGDDSFNMSAQQTIAAFP